MTRKDENIYVTGDSEGKLRLFDKREQSYIQSISGKDSMIIDMKFESEHKLWSISTAGRLRLFDSRIGKFITKTTNEEGGQITFANFHPTQPALATSMPNSSVNVIKFSSSERASVVKLWDNSNGPRITPISSLRFHPVKSVFALGTNEQFITVYK